MTHSRRRCQGVLSFDSLAPEYDADTNFVWFGFEYIILWNINQSGQLFERIPPSNHRYHPWKRNGTAPTEKRPCICVRTCTHTTMQLSKLKEN